MFIRSSCLNKISRWSTSLTNPILNFIWTVILFCIDKVTSQLWNSSRQVDFIKVAWKICLTRVGLARILRSSTSRLRRLAFKFWQAEAGHLARDNSAPRVWTARIWWANISFRDWKEKRNKNYQQISSKLTGFGESCTHCICGKGCQSFPWDRSRWLPRSQLGTERPLRMD